MEEERQKHGTDSFSCEDSSLSLLFSFYCFTLFFSILELKWTALELTRIEFFLFLWTLTLSSQSVSLIQSFRLVSISSSTTRSLFTGSFSWIMLSMSSHHPDLLFLGMDLPWIISETSKDTLFVTLFFHGLWDIPFLVPLFVDHHHLPSNTPFIPCVWRWVSVQFLIHIPCCGISCHPPTGHVIHTPVSCLFYCYTIYLPLFIPYHFSDDKPREYMTWLSG